MLLSQASAIGYKVCVPKLVVEEVVAKFKGKLRKEDKQASETIAGLSRLLQTNLDNPFSEIHLEKETELFRNRLTSTFSKSNTLILGYPCAPHRNIVKKAIERKRPFNSNGAGYRDALVWQTVLEKATEVNEPVALVTNDTDFGDKRNGLHGDLVEELLNKGLCHEKVVLIPSMTDLMDDHVRPSLKRAVWESLDQFHPGYSVKDEDSLALAFQEVYSGKEWYPEDLGLPGQYETLYLDSMEEVTELSMEDVRELSHNEFLAKIGATLTTTFDVLIHKSDWYILDDELDLLDPDWSRHYIDPVL